jgi:hypothetical protein
MGARKSGMAWSTGYGKGMLPESYESVQMLATARFDSVFTRG